MTARRLTAYSTRLRMNYIEPSDRPLAEPLDRPFAPVTGRDTEKGPPKRRVDKQRRRGGRLLGLGVLIGLVAALAFRAWSHHAQYSQGAAASQQRNDLVPPVRVATGRASGGILAVSLPATTLAFSVANIFARA